MAHKPTIDGSKAIPCPDPRCSLAFSSVDELRYHSQDAHCCDLQKFTARGSTSRAMSKENSNCSSEPKALDETKQIDFVNETMETLPCLCLESFAPEDDTGIKRKRGRPRKHCVTSSGELHSPAPKGEPSSKTKRGRSTKYGSKLGLASPSVKGKLGIKRTRGRPRRYSASSTGSSYRSTSSQSHDVQDLELGDELEVSNNESESESEYELVESSERHFLQGGYWVSSKRRRKDNYLVTLSRAVASRPQIVIYV
ncbi:hypothetical protein BJ878DRAFT_516664 [Calycina marina]|uniref:C2H2-type domain-containing protein n=1 Tax=Calycina marina TaxID=1763456 RepID=A0A9P8CCZ1_9HELO|nr:hypothetical protein BJ878DRAFT_516664 [Calycina marina]